MTNADASTQAKKARRSLGDVFQILKEHNHQASLIYPANLYVIITFKKETFHDKSGLKEFMATRSVLQ